MTPHRAHPILHWAAPMLVAAVLALTGCAAPASVPAPSGSSSTGCDTVSVVVEFGPLDEPALAACVAAGAAADVLVEAGVSTEGTVDYGDQVVCRVNGQPSAQDEVVIEGQTPFIETCQTLNAVAYWALWVRSAPGAEWEYAQEGVNTLVLTDGQSVGLVYTPGTESIPPTD